MSRFQFEMATEQDDAELRRILARTPMDGSMSIAFQREPSFFAALATEGRDAQVVVCRDSQARCIVGFGSCTVRTRFVNGSPIDVGYLSGLRVLPEYRRRGLLARGFRFFQQWHKVAPLPIYLTTILEENETAQQTLVGGRAGLPDYHFVGRFVTAAIRCRPVQQKRRDFEIRAASLADREAIVQFLKREGCRRQFFPKYEPDDFFSDSGTFRDLPPDDLLLAERDGELVGMIGGWNQSSFKQSIVVGYRQPIGWLRPIVNHMGGLFGLPLLPPPGARLSLAVAVTPIVAADDRELFAELLSELLSRRAFLSEDCLLIGMHERDPLLPVVRALRPRELVSRIYLAGWDACDAVLQNLDDRVPYLELGCL